MLPEIIFLIVFLAFVFEFFDASLGLGFGTTITAILVLIGYSPLEVIPSVLFANAVMGIIAGFIHHRFENVNFHWSSRDLKVAVVLTIFGIIGMLVAVLIALELPETFLRVYIGLLVLAIGIYILAHHKKEHSFHWKKISLLGLVAAFNKGMTGGGYGSILVGGQILSGINSKSAVGITA